LSLASFVVETDKFVSIGHRPNVVGVFGEVWQRLEGSRAALYENEYPDRDGAFSLLAVLDTQDAPRFIADMANLARFINASGLSADESDEAIDAQTVAALVADLAHDEYRVRQTAATKLGLVGPPALPALEKAAKSADAEVRFRAEALQAQINTLIAEQRKDLLQGDLLSRIQPNFAHFPRAEKRGGHDIDIVRLRLKTNEATYAADLKRLLGPDWNKLRLAPIGKQVVVMLGSNTALFERAIANVEAGEQGLAADARLARFRSRAPAEETIELHLSLSRSQELAETKADAKSVPEGGAPLSSLGISIAPQRVRLDLFAPFEEVKSVVKRVPWFGHSP
jgi:hypothetical protein